ncbi:MAG: hypothetical protein Q7K45_03695 [Nanoarchaeota archaeon]|nr:hypothetical protein [Nanoarchaeota archaeon]
MLDTQRLKEAESNVKNYLQEKLIWKYGSYQKEIFETYLRNYKDSLEVAQKLFEQNLSPLWIIVTSYYSMYYIANAALYKIGYKVGGKISHKVTADALIVFIRNKLKKELLEDYEEAQEEALEIIGKKTDEIISHFEKELEKRSIFQYKSTEEIKRAKAETSLKRAKEFIFEMKKML